MKIYNMNLIIYLLIFIIATSLIENNSYSVSLRFKNASKEDFKSLHVKIFGKDYFFNELKRGKQTQAINVEKTYRYCYAEAITSKDTIVFQPVDYVGETLYKTGAITIELYIFPEEGKERILRIR